MGKKVVLDTNFLLIPGQFNIDIFTQIEELMKYPFEFCILEGSLEELNSLAKGNSEDAFAAKLGFVLAKQKGLKTLPSSKPVDDAIVSLADRGVIVATQDKGLKSRVKKKGAKVITMRQKQRLIIE